jgi:phosphatidate cytidylyltransferase
MLRQRVITAVILLALILPALHTASPYPFIVLTLAFCAAATWEWMRLNSCTEWSARALGLAFVLACIPHLQRGFDVGLSPWTWWLAVALWLPGGAWALWMGPTRWRLVPAALRRVLGLGLIALCWLAMAHSRIIGVNFLLSVMCIVWMADIAAYFGGRAWGRRKLAPGISPGKSWEGALTGAVGVVLLSLLWTWLDSRFAFDSPSVFTLLRQRQGGTLMIVAVLTLTAASVVGDLFESLVKRAAGVKDSSALLPGHGGVLDRIDALLPVLPCALALTSI